jgi:hypothetical protein
MNLNGRKLVKLKDLIKEEITLSGSVKLYHYTQNEMGDSVILDPQIAIKNKSFWTNNDYKISDVPRVFYYTDLNKTERMVKTKNLYVGEVNGSNILNLTDSVNEYVNNPNSLEAKNKDVFNMIKHSMNYNVLNIDSLLRMAKQKFIGVYYVTGGLPIVNLFVPLTVKKMNA